MLIEPQKSEDKIASPGKGSEMQNLLFVPAQAQKSNNTSSARVNEGEAVA